MLLVSGPRFVPVELVFLSILGLVLVLWKVFDDEAPLAFLACGMKSQTYRVEVDLEAVRAGLEDDLLLEAHLVRVGGVHPEKSFPSSCLPVARDVVGEVRFGSYLDMP